MLVMEFITWWAYLKDIMWVGILLLAAIGLKFFVAVSLISANVLYVYLFGFVALFS